jgi:hypothetical protein
MPMKIVALLSVFSLVLSGCEQVDIGTVAELVRSGTFVNVTVSLDEETSVDVDVVVVGVSRDGVDLSPPGGEVISIGRFLRRAFSFIIRRIPRGLKNAYGITFSMRFLEDESLLRDYEVLVNGVPMVLGDDGIFVALGVRVSTHIGLSIEVQKK